MTAVEEAVDVLAEGLWRRMRDVVLAAARLERFNFAPGAAAAAPRPGWVTGLATDGVVLEAGVADLVRRAFAVGADPVNHRMLARLDGETEGMALGELARALDLPALAVAERVNDLVQVGLVGQVLERGAVETTAAGRAWVRLVDAVAGRLARHAREGLPGLLSG